MSNTVSIRNRSALPGGGFDSAGNPKQGKRRVVGAIAVTSYSGAESFAPSAAGLTAFDYVNINHVNQSKHVVRWNSATNDFYINPAGSGTHTLQFDVVGDELAGVELL